MKILRILLLEDSLLDAELTQAQLENGGLSCEIVRVEKREEFARSLESESFDLILADYSLPSFDGLSALQMVRAVQSDTPFIILSGALGEELAIETLKSGATDYVLKDRRERLVPSIHRALRETEERAERRRAEDALRFLAEASAVLSSSLDYHATLSDVAGLAVPLLADGCIVDVINEEGALQLVAVAHVEAAQQEAIRESRRLYPLDAAKDIGCARIITNDESAAVLSIDANNVQSAGPQSPHQDKLHQAMRHLDFHCCIVAPMITHERVLGVVSFLVKVPRRPSDAIDLSLAQDLARRVAMAVDNARMYRETREAVRARDEFLATLSHELRTPLNALLGWTQLLRTGELDEETARQALEIIERNTKSQAQLIEDLLEVSRIITGNLRLQMAPIELTMVIEGALDSVHPTAEAKSIIIEYSHETGAGLVSGDVHRLQQVVWNLLSNAIKFTPKGGRIAVSLSRVASHAQIKVTDTGQGIPPDFVPHVFERFRQADGSSTRRHGGLGLGLAIVRHITELHGGTVRAESEGEGKGATFIVQLPMLAVHEVNESDDAEVADTHAASDYYPIKLDGLRVLVVDDQADARRLVSAVLEHCGAEIVAAASAREALDALEGFEPHILVSDIGMPGEDGYSLIKQVREREKTSGGHVRAMALTAYARAEDKQKALRAGFQEYAVKPIEPAQLVHIVARLTGRDIVKSI